MTYVVEQVAAYDDVPLVEILPDGEHKFVRDFRPNLLHENTDEVCAALVAIADESMRCAAPVLRIQSKTGRVRERQNLYPDRTWVHTAIENGYAYVARNEAGTICGVALIWPEDHVRWLTLPINDGVGVAEALLDHYTDTEGCSPWGEVETKALRDLLLSHPDMSGDEKQIVWRQG